MTQKANERKAAYMTAEEMIEDKKIFVKNFGELLAQTRENISRCELTKDGNAVGVFYNSGTVQKVNVKADSYIAIMRDILRAI